MAPQPPVAAADELVLTRIIVARAARRHGLRASVSPVPFVGSVGSGAHQHFSLSRGDLPIFSGGPGARGMTPEGESAVAGLLAGLPAAQGVLCGSVLSGLRMQPGYWSGAHNCWGTENREAAVRFLAGGPSNPHGANVEVKVVDPSANPYLASATILGLAHHGIGQGRAAPSEVLVDPATLTDAQRDETGVVQLASRQSDALGALDSSELIREILGNDVVDAVLAVRRYEQQNYGDLEPEQLAEKFRMAWSV